MSLDGGGTMQNVSILPQGRKTTESFLWQSATYQRIYRLHLATNFLKETKSIAPWIFFCFVLVLKIFKALMYRGRRADLKKSR
jgi:hypothetical protein